MAKNNSNLVDENKVGIVSDNNLREKIYTIRGVPVMLDVDLAEIYGYSTGAFNRQVRNNKTKFDGEDFMFQLTEYEFENLKCKKCISSWGGDRHLPYVFTESGVYMLMTVLRGDLAIRQSRALIRMFRAMKNYIIESNNILHQKEQLQFMMQMADSSNRVKKIENDVREINDRVEEITKKLGATVTKSEISNILLDFTNNLQPQNYLILNGQPAKASEVYIDIYARAKYNIVIIDDYIDIKTLRHLQKAKNNIKITVMSDNKSHYLSLRDYQDFCKEFPDLKIEFIKTCRCIHDRFIVIDYDKNTERVFHCGASSKDAGYRMTIITEIKDKKTKRALNQVFGETLKNPVLVLS